MKRKKYYIFPPIAILIQLIIFTKAESVLSYEPYSLNWPVMSYECKDDPESPYCVTRYELGTSAGECQNFSWAPPMYIHPGIDIRGYGYHRDVPDPTGYSGDIIRLIADGYIWVTSNIDEDGCQEQNSCRLYILDNTDIENSNYIYYYSHLSLDNEDTETTSEVREAIVNAWQSVIVSPTDARRVKVAEKNKVSEGQILARITRFYSLYEFWDHLHLNIIDAKGNYDALNPLLALKKTEFIDDGNPEIFEIRFRPNEDATRWIEPEGECKVFRGNLDLDIVARMKDKFGRNPTLKGTDSIGIYSANYIIRNTRTGETYNGTWYRFDRIPIKCTGSQRGSECLDKLSIEEFFDYSIYNSPDSAFVPAENYAPLLFDSRSDTIWTGGSLTEKFFYILTNEWAIDGSWDTTLYDDGRYQITVEAWDEEGNGDALSTFVYVNNVEPVFQAIPDAYLRDNPDDNGAIPSTSGGRPFWTSPDIVVWLPPPEDPEREPDLLSNTPEEEVLMAGFTYKVYIRLLNEGNCVDVPNVKVKIYSANPQAVLNTEEINCISTPCPEGERHCECPYFVGDPDHPEGVTVPAGGRVFIGPFYYTPQEWEVEYGGHRCIIAMIDSADDPIKREENINVAEDNNIAQLNVQVGTTEYIIYNPEPSPAEVQLKFRCNKFPIYDAGSLVEMMIDYHPALEMSWRNVPGTEFELDEIENKIRLRFLWCNIALPPVVLNAHELIPASVHLDLPETAVGRFFVDFYEYVNSQLRGGVSFYIDGVILI